MFFRGPKENIEHAVLVVNPALMAKYATGTTVDVPKLIAESVRYNQYMDNPDFPPEKIRQLSAARKLTVISFEQELDLDKATVLGVRALVQKGFTEAQIKKAGVLVGKPNSMLERMGKAYLVVFGKMEESKNIISVKIK